MRREWEQGYLEIDFAFARFDSAWNLLVHSARVYFANLGFLAPLTLAVFLPAKLALQLISDWLDVSKGGLAAYLTMDLSDLVLSALAVPAAVYGLLEFFRTGKAAPLGRSLRWGRRQFAKTLWNKFKVEITITLWGALFLIPGIVKMVRLIFTDAVVAIEADRETAALDRSQELSRGVGWRIFAVLIPVTLVEFGGTYLALDAVGGTAAPRPVIALVDSLLSVCGQWSTVIVLLMYLGMVPAEPKPAARKPRRKNS
jgi:hypothetical protein